MNILGTQVFRLLLLIVVFTVLGSGNMVFAQQVKLDNHTLELKNVNGVIVNIEGSRVLKLQRDLSILPFDLARLESTVDEPTYAKLVNKDFKNGTIEVKVLSKIQKTSPFKNAQGFIGLAFRISKDDTKFESVYLRPRLGRSNSQFERNHTVQYFSYPAYKFDRLRKDEPNVYETYADVDLDEWIDLKLEIKDNSIQLFINNQVSPSFVVEKLKGNLAEGAIGLWVDIGTEGYFKDLKITLK